MKELKLQDLLRYGFSGGLFLVVLVLMHPAWREAAINDTGIGETATLVGLTVLVGSLIYALHRALLYRLVLTVALALVACFPPRDFDPSILLPLVPSRAELALDRWRLAMRQRNDLMDSYTAEWGAQVHLLYCSAWAIIFGVVIGRLFRDCASVLSSKQYSIVVTVMLVAAFWHHLRLLLWIRANRDQDFAVPLTASTVADEDD